MPRSRVLRGSVAVVGRGPRRATEWLASADQAAVVLAGNAARLDQAFSQAQIQALGPFTVVRVRGAIYSRSDQTASTENAFGAVGFMVVREQARVAGIASLPTPIAEEFDDGFFVHQFFDAGIQVATGTQVGNISLPRMLEFDSKAQRKVSSDDAIVVTVENGDASGLAVLIKFRMLIKFA